MGKEIWSMLYKLYTSFGKFGTPKANGRAPKTRFSAISCFFETRTPAPELSWEILN